jgi:hypothetical protein
LQALIDALVGAPDGVDRRLATLAISDAVAGSGRAAKHALRAIGLL